MSGQLFATGSSSPPVVVDAKPLGEGAFRRTEVVNAPQQSNDVLKGPLAKKKNCPQQGNA